MDDFEYAWDFGETVKLKETLDETLEISTQALTCIRILGDKDYKVQKAREALIDLESKTCK